MCRMFLIDNEPINVSPTKVLPCITAYRKAKNKSSRYSQEVQAVIKTLAQQLVVEILTPKKILRRNFHERRKRSF